MSVGYCEMWCTGCCHPILNLLAFLLLLHSVCLPICHLPPFSIDIISFVPLSSSLPLSISLSVSLPVCLSLSLLLYLFFIPSNSSILSGPFLSSLTHPCSTSTSLSVTYSLTNLSRSYVHSSISICVHRIYRTTTSQKNVP